MLLANSQNSPWQEVFPTGMARFWRWKISSSSLRFTSVRRHLYRHSVGYLRDEEHVQLSYHQHPWPPSTAIWGLVWWGLRQHQWLTRKLERRYRGSDRKEDRAVWLALLKNLHKLFRNKRGQLWTSKITEQRNDPRMLWASTNILLGQSRTSAPTELGAHDFTTFFGQKLPMYGRILKVLNHQALHLHQHKFHRIYTCDRWRCQETHHWCANETIWFRPMANLAHERLQLTFRHMCWG